MYVCMHLAKAMQKEVIMATNGHCAAILSLLDISGLGQRSQGVLSDQLAKNTKCMYACMYVCMYVCKVCMYICM